MASYKFSLGDRVRLTLENGADNNPQDAYTISRVLPMEGNVRQYRVQRVGDRQERAVTEHQLVMIAQDAQPGRIHLEAQQDLQRVRNADAVARARAAAKRAGRDRR